MAEYGQFCPVALTAEIFAERWTPIIIRSLLEGAETFNELQRGAPLMSRSLLAKRLKELEKAGVIERKIGPRGPRYVLTEAGEEFGPIIEQLGVWGQRWGRNEIEPGPLDPRMLMWAMTKRINTDRLPGRRVVVQFDFTDVARTALKRTWLVLESPDVDACYRDPGYEVDLVVTAALRTLVLAWMGDVPLMHVIRSGDVRIEGRRELVAGFPKWLALSHFAGVERPGAGTGRH